MAAATMAKVSTSVVATPSIHANRAPSALSSAASFRTAALSSKLSALALKTSASSNSSSSSGSAVVRVRADATAAPERFRLNNLSPQDGSRRKNKRKGRGYGAGQGGSCGFGMRGQKSRSGPGVRPGFEGGQMPLYRRLPKLKGIAGGMGAGLPKYVAINLADLNELDVADGAEVSLDTLKALRVLNPSGRDRTLPLKVLGDGEITRKLTVKAASFSSAAREKLEAAGCTVVEEPRKTKWLGAAALKRKKRLEEFIASKQQ